MNINISTFLRKILSFIIVIISGSVFSQSLIASLNEDRTLIKSEELFTIEEKTSSEFVTAVRNGNLLRLNLLDESFKIINSLETESLDYVFKWSRLGHRVQGRKYYVYNFKSKNNLLKILTFDFDKNEITEKDITLPIKKQRAVQSFTYDNAFYLVTVHKNSSKLSFYKVDSDENFTSHDVALPEYFRDSKRRSSTLYNVLFDQVSFSDVQKIDRDFPVSIDQAVYFSKLYIDGSNFMLTADANTAYTYIVEVDLNTFEEFVHVFAKEQLSNNDLVTRHNSFLVDRELYVLTANADECYVDKWDIDKLKKSPVLSFTKKEDIFLKNPVLYSDIDNEEQTELLKNKKILRNNSKGTKGFSIFDMGDNYLVFMGNGVVRSSGGYGMQFGLTSLAIAALQPNLVMFQPTGIDDSKERLRAYYDKDFKLINEPIEPNALEKLGQFVSDLDFKNSGLLFKFNEVTTYVALNRKTGEITFYQ